MESPRIVAIIEDPRVVVVARIPFSNGSSAIAVHDRPQQTRAEGPPQNLARGHTSRPAVFHHPPAHQARRYRCKTQLVPGANNQGEQVVKKKEISNLRELGACIRQTPISSSV